MAARGTQIAMAARGRRSRCRTVSPRGRTERRMKTHLSCTLGGASEINGLRPGRAPPMSEQPRFNAQGCTGCGAAKGVTCLPVCRRPQEDCKAAYDA